MTVFVLELNDAELRIAAGTRVCASAPGFAAFGATGLTFGRDAVRQFRLRPREASNLYWHRLDTEPLPVRHARAANHADLVFRHLEALAHEVGIGPADELVVAAPATTTAAQLSLLLGIAEGVGLRVTGLVDAAIAAAATQHVPERFLHLDVSLHRFVATRAEGGEQVRRSGAQDLTELSQSSLLESWVNLIADRFVRETRFDPLAVADTEQQMYDQVYDWLAHGRTTPLLSIRIERQNVDRRIEIASSQLLDKATQRYPLLERAFDGTPVFLSHRADALPGLTPYLRTRGMAVAALPDDAVFAGVERHLDAIRSDPDSVRFVTRLPSAGRSATAAPHAAAATHVLLGATALPIGAGVRLDRGRFPGLPAGYVDGGAAVTATPNGPRLSLAAGVAAAIDGRPAADGAALEAGAELEISGVRFRLIRVLDRG